MLTLVRNHPLLTTFIIVSNIALSIWCIYTDPIINYDGILYLEIAEQFKLGQWKVAFEHYSWPFYSFFIYLTSFLFSLDTEPAARVLNALLATSLTIAFVSIVNEMSPKNRYLLLIASLLILLFPSINKYRTYISRDFGYLSFYLWSLYYVFHYVHTQSKSSLIKWFFASLASMLFRIEGIVFIYMIPCLLLFWSAHTKTTKRLLLSACIILGIISIIGIAVWFLSTKYGSILHQIQTSNFYLGVTLDLFYQELNVRLGPDYPRPIAIIILISSILGTVAFEIVRRLAVFYFFFSIIAIKFKLALKQHLELKVWLSYISINLCLICFFYFLSNFFVSRYTMSTVLTLLITSPFLLERLTKTRMDFSKIQHYGLSLLYLMLILVSLKGLDLWDDNRHFIKAGDWISKQIDQQANIYSNNPLILHYANKRPFADRTRIYSDKHAIENLKNHRMQQYDYFIFQGNMSRTTNQHNAALFQQKYGQPIHTVLGNKEDRIFIYKTH